MQILDFLFSYRGRVGRLAYFAGTTAVGTVVGLLAAVLGSIGHGGAPGKPSALMLLLLPALWPILALNIKRYHDLGMSGWWTAFPIGTLLVGVFGFLALLAGGSTRSGGLAGTGIVLTIGFLVLLLVSLWNMIRLMFFSGEAGANQYGHRPPSGLHLLGGSHDRSEAEVEGSWAERSISNLAAATAASAVATAGHRTAMARHSGPINGRPTFGKRV